MPPEHEPRPINEFEFRRRVLEGQERLEKKLEHFEKVQRAQSTTLRDILKNVIPHQEKPPKMIITLDLDATQPVAIGVTATDSEGDAVDAGAITGLTITTRDVQGDFGTVTEDPAGSGDWTYNPGKAGATGVIVADATLNGVAHEASANITLKAGAATDFELEFTPKVGAPAPTP